MTTFVKFAAALAGLVISCLPLGAPVSNGAFHRTGNVPLEFSSSASSASPGSSVTITVTMSGPVDADTVVNTGWTDVTNHFTGGVSFSGFPSTITVHEGNSVGNAVATVASNSQAGIAQMVATANGGSATGQLDIQ